MFTYSTKEREREREWKPVNINKYLGFYCSCYELWQKRQERTRNKFRLARHAFDSYLQETFIFKQKTLDLIRFAINWKSRFILFFFLLLISILSTSIARLSNKWGKTRRFLFAVCFRLFEFNWRNKHTSCRRLKFCVCAQVWQKKTAIFAEAFCRRSEFKFKLAVPFEDERVTVTQTRRATYRTIRLLVQVKITRKKQQQQQRHTTKSNNFLNLTLVLSTSCNFLN
jgi:hypothetical protein